MTIVVQRPGSGDALTTDPLSQFAATTSSQLAGVLSDETGTGLLPFATSPSFLGLVTVTGTSEQLRLRFDASNFASFTVDSGGVLTIAPSGNQIILQSSAADTVSIVTTESTGTNGGITRKFVTSRDPNGNITGAGGNEAVRDSAALSGTFESREATTGTNWFKRSVNPSTVVEINSQAEYDDLFTAGSLTVSGSLTLVLKTPVSSASVFVITGGLTITAFNIAGPVLTYSGTGTLFTGSGSLIITENMTLTSTSTGTLMSMTGSELTFVLFEDSQIVGWDDLGTYTGGVFLVRFVSFFDTTTGFVLTDVLDTAVFTMGFFGTAMTGVGFTYNTKVESGLITFDQIQAVLSSTGSVFDFPTTLSNAEVVTVIDVSLTGGNIYKQSTLSDATINSVADGTISAGTITAMADNGSSGTTISSTTTYFAGEEVTITGTTSYNGTFQIFTVVAGVSFDIQTAFVADDATGSIATVRLAMTLAGGHGITAGNDLKVNDANFYNGFVHALNVATNVLTVNGTFVATDTGTIERELSLDQSDPRIVGANNNGVKTSQVVAFGFTNANATTTSITDGTYIAIDCSTFSAGEITERMKLTNAVNGIFELISIGDFSGFLTGSLAALKTGSTVNYRFAMSLNGALPVFATANYIPMEVKTTKVNIPLEFSVSLVKGDTVQIMVAGDGTADDLTVTDLVFGIK